MLKYKLDEVDLKLLEVLQEDGRLSSANISRRIGAPISTVHDKIARLRAKGVIKGFTAILNKEVFGLEVVALVGVETGAELYGEVAERLSEMDEVVEVYGVTAQFDLHVKIVTNSLRSLNNTLNVIRSMKGVDNIFVTTVLETFKEEHKYRLYEPVTLESPMR